MQPDRLRLVPYRPELAARWNAFVRDSKNGTFLFDRGYMDYHADRFRDASLMAFEGDDESNLVALLPASRSGDQMISHGGLTYGGWVTDQRMTTLAMLTLFERLRSWVPESGLASLRYKVIPHCYHRLPAEEDLYALFSQGVAPSRVDVTSVIDLGAGLAWSKGRKHALSKARRLGIEVIESTDFEDFITCLGEVLAVHGAQPVHTVAELERLAGQFPEEIRLYSATLGGRAVAYVLVYDTGQVAHTQYMASRPDGRTGGGLEAIIYKLQYEICAGRRYISFGISTESEGRVLNTGLIAQKEMFGGRAMVSSFFDLTFG